MKEIILKGIVIKSTDYKDSDKIVTIFSADKGLIRARARGVKKDKAKLAFATQTFAFVEFVLIDSGGFYTIKNATNIDSFFNLTLDFDAYILMLACLEVCSKTVKENLPEPELFIALLETLKYVCYENINPIYAFIKFMLISLKILGFEVKVENCACCGNVIGEKTFNFSYDYNGVICEKCANKFDSLELTRGEYMILKNINQATTPQLANLKFLSREDLVSIVSLLSKIFRVLIGDEIETVKQFL